MKYIFQIIITICATNSLFASEPLLEKKLQERNKAQIEVRVAKSTKEKCSRRAGIASAVAAYGWASGNPFCLYSGIAFTAAGICFAGAEHNQQKKWQAKKNELEVEIAALQPNSAVQISTLAHRKPHRVDS